MNSAFVRRPFAIESTKARRLRSVRTQSPNAMALFVTHSADDLDRRRDTPEWSGGERGCGCPCAASQEATWSSRKRRTAPSTPPSPPTVASMAPKATWSPTERRSRGVAEVSFSALRQRPPRVPVSKPVSIRAASVLVVLEGASTAARLSMAADAAPRTAQVAWASASAWRCAKEMREKKKSERARR